MQLDYLQCTFVVTINSCSIKTMMSYFIKDVYIYHSLEITQLRIFYLKLFSSINIFTPGKGTLE